MILNQGMELLACLLFGVNQGLVLKGKNVFLDMMYTGV